MAGQPLNILQVLKRHLAERTGADYSGFFTSSTKIYGRVLFKGFILLLFFHIIITFFYNHNQIYSLKPLCISWLMNIKEKGIFLAKDFQ